MTESSPMSWFFIGIKVVIKGEVLARYEVTAPSGAAYCLL